MFRRRSRRLFDAKRSESFLVRGGSSFFRRPTSSILPKIIIALCIFVFFVISGIGLGIIVGLWNNLPSMEMVKSYEGGGFGLQTTIYSIDNKLITKFAEEKRELVSLNEIPKNLINAIIAIEDTNFYHHRGINLKGILRAFIMNIKAGRTVQGGSTITQQLAKNIFLTQERTYKRKIQEALLAILIERELTKEEILERYLNKIYFGHGNYGVQAASLFYFDKPIFDIDLGECAMLSALPSSPSRFSPIGDPQAALKRQNLVLDRMNDLGFITDSEAEVAKISFLGKIKKYSSKKAFANARTTINRAPYFTEYIRQKLEEEYGSNAIYRGGLKVYTSLDIKMQEYAQEALCNALERLNKNRSSKNQRIEGALLVIEPKTGYIKAMVGGSGFTKMNQMNRVYARRQPGSSFKPFIYAAAIEKGLTPITLLEDSPVSYPGANGTVWEPTNYDGKFYGRVTMRTALEQSLNIATIKLLEQVGTRRVIAIARRLGIKGNLAKDLSLSLGVSEVSPLEMTTAFAAIANQGVKVSPMVIRYVKDYNGNLLEERTAQTQRVLSPQTAYILTNMMQGVTTRGTARAAVGQRLGRVVAGKTGTTNDYVDAWFIGFTPELLATVWIGYDKGQISLGHGQTGGVVAAPIWTDFMQKVLSKTPASDFPVPEGVVFKTICHRTGLLATDTCSNRISEVFLEGTEPTKYCSHHDGSVDTEEYEGVEEGTSSTDSTSDINATEEYPKKTVQPQVKSDKFEKLRLDDE